jgi:hypothetical protein
VISKFVILGLGVLFFQFGCATAYQSFGLTGGFSETKLAPDLFRVVFRGNGYTHAERAQDFALLRASELTLQGGFKCFAVIDESNTTDVSSFTAPGSMQTTAYGTVRGSGNIYVNPYGASYSGTSNFHVNSSSTYTPPQTYVFYKPVTGILVRAFQAKPSGVFAFDASFLQRSLKEKYQIR